VKAVSKIIFASALALSADAPALAYETASGYQTQVSTTGSRAQHVTGKHVRTHRGIDANAYEPASAPVGVDFSIGSQR
jgi:hypothetical protein